MKFKVLALDYDGTIAQDGRLNAEVRSAIIDARARGLVVVLVTGRILDDLRRVAGDVSFLDGIVAENGAAYIGPQVGPRGCSANRRRRISWKNFAVVALSVNAGKCVVEADANFAPADFVGDSRDGITAAVAFNRRRLMVLPQGVCKGAGLRTALAALRLSVHNAIGIGDAENDHDLLAACEIGVAVGWGSKTLQESADRVLDGKRTRSGGRISAAHNGRTEAAARANRTSPIIVGHFR